MEAEKDPALEAALEAASRKYNLPYYRAMGLPVSGDLATDVTHPQHNISAPTAQRADASSHAHSAAYSAMLPAPGAGPSTSHGRTLAQDDGVDGGAGSAEGPAEGPGEPSAPAGTSGSTPQSFGDTHALRFHTVYQLGETDPDFDSMLQEEVMPRAMRALSRVLRVKNRPEPSRLALPQRCASAGTCTPAPICNGALPQEPPEDLFVDCATGDCGREDTDFIVFVTARQTDVCRPTTTAHAVTCIIDRDNAYGLPNRPLAGHVNFCPSAGRGGAAAAEPRSLEAAVDTAVHELLHALYMSAGLYPFFPGGMDGTVSADGRSINTAAVKSAVREQFDCDGAEGAPIEDGGGRGTALSHWEETAFFTEVMVGVSGSEGRRVLSAVTLALAEDSGWYTANFQGAGFLRHGHLAGCDMLGSCRAVPPETRAGQNFCGSDDRCRNHDETAWCADSTLSPCPLLRPTIGGDCKLAGNLFAQFGNAGGAAQPAALAAGVHFGPSAICLGVPGGRFARTGVSAWRLSETCFASECDDSGALTVLVRDAEGEGFSRYPCPEGEMITLLVEDGFEEGMEIGPCPPAEEVCPYKGCPENQAKLCDGQGWCNQGACRCAVDRSGAACTLPLCDTDADCPSDLTCSETHECLGEAELPQSSSPLDFDASFADFQPLRAVRVGYMRSCVFFGDDNGDERPSISLGERSQPTGSHGELALYLPGEAVTLASPVRQLSNESDCSDTLSGKRRMALLFQIPAGMPSQDASVTVFSTAASLLLLRDRSMELAAATAQVAAAFGIKDTQVAGRDWLRQLANRDESTANWRAAAELAAASIAAVVATEQVAAYTANAEPGTRTRTAADTFLRQLVQPPAADSSDSGSVLRRLQSTEWLQQTITGMPAVMQSDAIATTANTTDAGTPALDDLGLATAGLDDAVPEGEAEEEVTPAQAAQVEARRRLADAGGSGDDGGGADEEPGAVTVDLATQEDGEGPPGGDVAAADGDGDGGGSTAGGAVAALSVTVAIVTDAIVTAAEGKSAEDLEAVLQRWAGLAHVAEGDFAIFAAQLGRGDVEPSVYETLTDDAALEAGAEAYSVDLSEATKLQEADFLSRYTEKIVDWLQREHLGVIGWAWLAMGLVATVLLCTACCVSRARSKKPFVPPAITNRLPAAVSTRLPAAATRPIGLAPPGGKRAAAASGDSVPVYVRNAAPEDFAASGGVVPAEREGGGRREGRRELGKPGSLLRGRHAGDRDGHAYVDHEDLVEQVEARQANLQHGGGARALRDTGVEMARQFTRSLSRSVSSPRRGYKRLDEPDRQPHPSPPPPQ